MDDVTSANILYGSIIGDYRSTGIATEADHISKFDAGSKDIYSFEQDLTEFDGNFQKKAGASFDSVFSPYSTYLLNPGSGLPGFEVPTNKGNPNSLTLNPFNPNNSLSLYYAPTGSLLYQSSLITSGNPTPTELAFSQVDTTSRIGKERGDLRKGTPTGWMESGHSIQMAVNGTGNRYSTDFDYQFTESSGYDVEVTNIRAVGFRGPMVLSGWGFDTDGFPVPADTGDPTIFASGAFKNPDIQKTGPIDLRWDNDRKVWTNTTKVYLSKATNTYNPSSFSYEVDRSDSRSQFTRSAPGSLRTVNLTEPIHDPESVAYTDNSNNVGSYEQLDYVSIDYPFYEAFIIRSNTEQVASSTYYNIWSEDCQDCGHITNSGCGTQHGDSSIGKKILIENPLRQNIDVGDLMFTMKTGRRKKVNTGTFTGGTGSGATGEILVDSNGVATTTFSPGTGYTLGAFAIAGGNICVGISLGMTAGGLTSITLDQTTGFTAGTYPLTITPNDAAVTTEELDIHWIMQAEFKTQQIVTHVECEGGILQSCSQKIQTQGFSSCEWCGEDTTYINSF
tara:strand:- start:9919 stop:11604 length:1686 start_codon:yes stop_codon:yes gene_type:complete